MKKLFLLFFLVTSLLFTEFTFGQCTIATTTNASALNPDPCTSLVGCGGILYIGNGSASMSLLMDANLNLTCLGPIQFIVRNNAILDFSGGNFDLTLAAGSAIVFEAGSNINGGTTSCSNSDRIKIGSEVIATCQGGGTPQTFPELVSAGGYSPIIITSSPTSPACSGSFRLTATASPSAGATIRWYTVASGGTSISSLNPYDTPVINTTTTYYAEAQYASYTTVRRSIVLTINPNNTAGPQSSTAPICQGVAMVSITHSTTGATGIGVASGLPTGLSASWASNVITISGTPTTIGPFNYTIPLTGGCGSVSATGSITVNPAPATPTLTLTTQPSCSNPNGTFAITNYNGSYSYAISPNTGVSRVNDIVTAPAGSYTVTALNSGCASSSSLPVNLTGVATKTWNGAWSPPGAPTIANAVIINSGYSTATNGNFSSCSLTINSGATLTINSLNYIEVQNGVANNGTLTIENNGSLIQVNDLSVNTGAINMQRTAQVDVNDYVFWSSPVENFNSVNISPTTTNKIYKWIPTVSGNVNGHGTWVGAREIMEIGKGYIERGLNTSLVDAPFTATFTGVPNNGVKTVSISRGNWNSGNYNTTLSNTDATNDDDNWNLVGNPYPSSISLYQFLETNTNIDGFIEVWAHGIPPSATAPDPFYADYGYNYDIDDYIRINKSGSAAGSSSDSFIASGQGFIVLMPHTTASATGQVTFNNAMRKKEYPNNVFYRTTAKNSSQSKGRIWLDIVSTTASNRILVGYVDGATNKKDRLYDAKTDLKLNLSLFSIIENEGQTIQGRSLPFDDKDEVALGIKVPKEDSYSIAIGEVDGFFVNPNQNIYLEDKKLGLIHDLRTAPYSFTASSGFDIDRFVLRYTDNKKSRNEDFESVNNSVKVFGTANFIQIQSQMENIQSYEVYNIVGQSLAAQSKIDANQVELHSISKNNRTLIVKVTLISGQTVTKKIIF